MRDLLESIAEELRAACGSGVPIPLLSARYPGLTAEDAYRVQRINRDWALKQGHRILGYKIGLSAREQMRSMGVEEPDYGVLYEGTELPEHSTADWSRMCAPKVEGEIGFLLGADLPEHAAPADVLAATAEVCAAFEFPETRIGGWENQIADTVSDNSSAGHWMRSSLTCSPAGIDLAAVRLTLRKNGAVLAEGTSDVVLGSPLNSVAWLSNKLSQHGTGLKKGQFVLSGALCGAHLAAPGDVFEAEFDQGLGTLSVTFR